jgi:hypothetical protein
MNKKNPLHAYVVHYSPLLDRRSFLSANLIVQDIASTWVTENDFLNFDEDFYQPKKILGVSEKLVGMDLGINSRSLSRSRQKARAEGIILLFRSYLSKNNNFVTGSIPAKQKMKNSMIELQKMHLTALAIGTKEQENWVLVLEDDAVPSEAANEKITSIVKNLPPVNTWISLNSGAGLHRTKSEKLKKELGIFRVKPAATRCAVAYLISIDLAKKIIDSALSEGVPNWLPIDFYYQVLLRKFKSTAYWTDPAFFEQGSETGKFISGFEHIRQSDI